ncbi:unnamed protein product [Caenorhabditis brenneri]
MVTTTSTYQTVQPSTKEVSTTVNPHTTVQLSTSTTSSYPIDSCTPHNATTYLFAYSTDLDGSIIDHQLDYFKQLQIPPLYTTFAVVRLDMRSGLEFVFLNHFSSLISYVQSHYPVKSSGFGDPNTGSNVLTMIDSFLDNHQVPVCGSKMLLLIKRYPNENDISQIVTKLRQYHSFPIIMISNSPSGGNNREILYDLASKTNGLCGYYDDSQFGPAVYAVPSCFHPYMVYAANPLVSGKGTLHLKSLEPPVQDKFWFTFTDQDYGKISAMETILLKWVNDSMGLSLGIYNNKTQGNINGNEISGLVPLRHAVYDVTLYFEYTDSRSRVLQIRVYGSDFVEDWQPYDD